tara:strand:- start:114 stop:527 length:414 start_codon:yes stop_codon:yes gene_type:complete
MNKSSQKKNNKKILLLMDNTLARFALASILAVTMIIMLFGLMRNMISNYNDMATDVALELMTIQTVTVTDEFKDFDKPIKLPVERLNVDSIDIDNNAQTDQRTIGNMGPEQIQVKSKALSEMLQKKKEIISILESEP